MSSTTIEKKQSEYIKALRTEMRASMKSGEIAALKMEYPDAAREYSMVSIIATELSEHYAATDCCESAALADGYRSIAGIYAGRASDMTRIQRV